MPSKKPEKIRKVLPEGSIALSLLGNKNFTNNEVFLHRTYSANAQLHNGTFFTCLERYGGNSFELIYPYIHLSSTTKLLPKIVSENGKSEWIESGFYLELDHISNVNHHHTFSEQKIDYVIFIGVRIDNEALPSIIEHTWRSWSKVGLLCNALNNCKITVLNVTFFRLVSPYSTFNYCILVSLELKTNLDRVKCLNVLQKLRGSTMPGYISLFQRFEYDPKNLKSQDIEDEFNEIFNTIEKAQRDKKYRKRPVNTV